THPGSATLDDARARHWPRTSEPGDLHPLSAPAQWAQPAATRRTHVGAAHLRFQNRKRESHAYAVFPGTAGACTGGYRARSAQRRRTHPSGRSQRTDERSVYRGVAAVCRATERDADVEHSDPGAGSDGEAAAKRLGLKVSAFQGFKVVRLRLTFGTLKPCHLEISSLSGQLANTKAGTDV